MGNGEIPGMLTREQLSDEIERGEIDTVLTVFPDMYGRLMGKRVTGRFFQEHVAADGIHACDYLLACDMEMDTVPGYAFSNWERGYGDVHLAPDLSTLRRAAWLPRTARWCCATCTRTPATPPSRWRRVGYCSGSSSAHARPVSW